MVLSFCQIRSHDSVCSSRHNRHLGHITDKSLREPIFVLNTFLNAYMVLVDESEKFVAALVQEPSLTVVVRDRILWEWEFCHFLEF